MRYAGIIKNDVVNGQDVCVSVWVQGCHFRCPGCHNPEAWDFDGGIEIDENELIEEVMRDISLNGVQRNLSVLGGEPLCDENIEFVKRLIQTAKDRYPNIQIFVWSGYTFEEIFATHSEVFDWIDYLIDGRFEIDKRDITLPLRGSTNQRIISLREGV